MRARFKWFPWGIFKSLKAIEAGELLGHDWNYFSILVHTFVSACILIPHVFFSLYFFCVFGTWANKWGNKLSSIACPTAAQVQHEMHSAAWKQFYTGLWVGGPLKRERGQMKMGQLIKRYWVQSAWELLSAVCTSAYLLHNIFLFISYKPRGSNTVKSMQRVSFVLFRFLSASLSLEFLKSSNAFSSWLLYLAGWGNEMF